MRSRFIGNSQCFHLTFTANIPREYAKTVFTTSERRRWHNEIIHNLTGLKKKRDGVERNLTDF